jgi:hypothetical protein
MLHRKSGNFRKAEERNFCSYQVWFSPFPAFPAFLKRIVFSIYSLRSLRLYGELVFG